ncbi:MAG: thioredoxin family protein, partial [Xanthomonadaceae bacterium]|nr:thioredoxin family protein [Xanthomonadaceae bacterium]
KLLPKAGPWMDTIKQLFGAMMLAVCAWVLSRVLSPRLMLLVWAVPGAVAAAVLWRGARGIRHLPVLARVAGAAVGAYALLLVAGAGLGGTDPLLPLPAWSAHPRELSFRTIKSVSDLDHEVQRAQASGRPVMLDFYADWCVSCKEMEKFTFTDPRVKQALSGFVLLQADVTANDATDQALMKHFGIVAPPDTLFFGADGAERRDLQLTGPESAGKFVQRVDAVRR